LNSDPVYYLDADPNPNFTLMLIRIRLSLLCGFESDLSRIWIWSDPAPHQSDANLRQPHTSIVSIHGSIGDFKAPESWRFDADPDPDPAFRSDSDPDSASQNDADLDHLRWSLTLRTKRCKNFEVITGRGVGFYFHN
jgi:hypothetical protein